MRIFGFRSFLSLPSDHAVIFPGFEVLFYGYCGFGLRGARGWLACLPFRDRENIDFLLLPVPPDLLNRGVHRVFFFFFKGKRTMARILQFPISEDSGPTLGASVLQESHVLVHHDLTPYFSFCFIFSQFTPNLSQFRMALGFPCTR